MIATRKTDALPLFVTFGTRERKMSQEAEGSLMSFIYDPVNQVTFNMGASGTMSRRSVRRKALFGHYDSNEETKDDE